MKLLINILLIFVSTFAFSQNPANNPGFGYTGSLAEIYTPEKLAILLTSNDSTARQKVNSIFKWVTGNIAYNTKAFKYTSSRSKDYLLEEEEEDTAATLKPLNLRVAQIVLKRKTAVCDGYARLFKTLCDYADVKCEIITGYARTNINRIGARFVSNHKWNAVFIDTSWYLLDATWASGYINYRDEFERAYIAGYYLAEPSFFFLDHYPEEQRWALLPNAPLPAEFKTTPFKTAAFNRNYILSFKPVSGIIYADVGDSIVIEVETNRIKRKLWVTDNLNVDSSSLAVLQCCGFINPPNTINGNKISVTFKDISAETEWLNVIYDDELIMRYKLNVRKDRIDEKSLK